MNKIYTEPVLSELSYRLAKQFSLKLGVPFPECFLELEVRMPDGTVTHRHKQRSHSWVKNAYDILLSSLAAVGNLEGDDIEVYNTSGTKRTSLYQTNLVQDTTHHMQTAGYGYMGASGSVTSGIVVGTGNGAETFDSSAAAGYALGTLIANGAGAGQMSYAQGEIYTIVTALLVKTVTHIRYINNNSGGSIGVNECGIYGRYEAANTTDQYIMVCRDLLGSTVTVANTGQLKVTYTIALTYPA